MSKQVNVDMADAVTSEGSLDKSNKIMAQADATVGRTVEANLNTDTPTVPGNFHEFNGSQAKMYTTYSNRMDKIAAALGNKAPLVS